LTLFFVGAFSSFRRFVAVKNFTFMRFLTCALIVTVVALSCKDDQLYGINADTRTYLLANKKWQNSAIYVTNAQGNVIRDEYTPLPEYRKDDYLLLRSDSTYELNDNVAKDPSSAGAVLSNGRWQLVMNEQFIDFNPQTGAVFGDSVQITMIDGSSFIVQMPAIDGTRYFSFRAMP
jgi:hypothetical protein